jgi:phytoene desaturase
VIQPHPNTTVSSLKQRKVIIVGAGPGGLAAALLLRNKGLDVTILEKQSQPGGRTSVIRGDGYQFDLGPTFFLYPQILQEIFREIGRDMFEEIPMVKLDPQYRIIFGAGGELNATPDLEKMVAEIAKLSPHDAQGFRRFMRDNRVKLEKFTPCLQTPFLGWKSLCQTRLLTVLPFLKPWKSLHSELSGYFTDPRLQLAFTFQSKYLGMSPFQCPSLFSILSYLEYEHGIWHPIGGCNSITHHMARIAREMGVKIELETPVDSLILEGKKAVGARTSKGDFHADQVIINADFGKAITKLIPNEKRKKWSDRNVASKSYSCSTFMLYLGVEGKFDHLSHHNIYIAKDYKKNLREIESDHVLSEEPSFYVENPCVTDPSMAPEGHSSLYVLIPVSHQHANIDWSKEKIRYRNLAIKQLEKMGITDLESRIRFEKVVTPDDWESKIDVYKGATFNLSHSFSQMLHLRPRNRFEDLQSVYLVGGGTHPGSGLPVIFESARISSELVLQEAGVV